MEELALQASSLSKSFGTLKAVNGIDFSMRRGEILGLLGPNGSGKSTTMKMILGILKPDTGSIVVEGIDVARDPIGVKRIVGYVPETPQIYDFLTGIEYLDFISDMYSIPTGERAGRIGQFLDGLQLRGHENELISGYSQGMKQKIAIISALLHRPKVLVLDEATSNLDLKSETMVEAALDVLLQGRTAVLIAHRLSTAMRADRIVVVGDGRLLEVGSHDELVALGGHYAEMYETWINQSHAA